MQRTDPDEAPAAASTLVAIDHASDGPSRTILLVEDEAFVREVACEILSGAGYRVLKAGNAAEALHAFHKHAGAVQLLLTDVVLPDRSGCDLALDLSALRGGVNAIFISGYPENLITKEGLPRQEWSYLPKPFSAAALIKKVREALPDESHVG